MLRRGLGRIGWVALWLPGALLALLMAGAFTVWVWAGTQGSLATTLDMAQSWMHENPDAAGQLEAQGAEGSLREGGRIASLVFQQGALNVQAKDVRLDWTDALWTNALQGKGIHLDLIHIGQLDIDDQRPPEPTEPMESLIMPLDLSTGFEVNQLNLTGKTPLTLSDIKGQYRYLDSATAVEPNEVGLAELPATAGLLHAHRLRLDTLRFAGGQYSAGLHLGAEAPMPLVLALNGDIQTQVPDGAGVQLTAKALVTGALAGQDAVLQVTADAQGQTTDRKSDTPTTLNLKARIQPWADQPLLSAQGNTAALNLAALWPTAPSTDLSGQLQIQPDGEVWRVKLDLDNAKPGPADQKALPLKRLKATIEQQGPQWTISELKAVLGDGDLAGKGSFRLDTTGNTPVLSAWQGEVKAKGLRPIQIWSELAPGALDASLEAKEAATANAPEAVAVQASIQPSQRQADDSALKGMRLKAIRLKGLWQPVPSEATATTPNLGLFDIEEASMGIAGAQLDAQGQIHTAKTTFDGELSLQLPGAKFAASGLLAQANGKGRAQIELLDAEGLLAWVRGLQTLPFVGENIKAAMAGQEALKVNGNAKAVLQWTGGLGEIVSTTTATATAKAPQSNRKAQPKSPLKLEASLEIPQLNIASNAEAPIEFKGVSLQAKGNLTDLQITSNGNVISAPWRGQWNTTGQWRGQSDFKEGGTIDLSRLQLTLQPDKTVAESSNIEGWTLETGQALKIHWKPHTEYGMLLESGGGELLLKPLFPTQPSALSEPLVVAWQKLAWKGSALETQGRLQGLTLPWIDALSAVGQPKGSGPLGANGVRGDLVFDGAWNITLPADAQTPMELSATLQRRSGDMQWLANGNGSAAPTATASAAKNKGNFLTNGTGNGNEPVAAGVKDARISLTVTDRQLQAKLRWDSDRLGQASADFTTPLNRHSANDPSKSERNLIDRWWPQNSPLQGTAKAKLPQVGVWSMFAPPGWRMRGTLSADAKLSGTRSAPKWHGEIQADDLALRSVVDGFAFTNGLLRATLDGERIEVNRFSLQGPGGAQSGGSLEASGQALWRTVPGPAPGAEQRQPLITLKAKADRLRVSNRPDRRLTLSGDVSAQLAGAQLQLRGDLKVDSASYIMPDELAPSLGSDVVIRSTNTAGPDEAASETVKPDVLVNLDLGQQFEVRGQGLSTRLSGQLTVRATPALPTPRVMGEVRTVSGTYRAYGQQLNIETGILRFTGPYDDPALDILAVRKMPKNTEQRVGVQISGNVQAPRVALYAEPDLPDGDKLAWLVLGKPASAAGAQAFVLQQAARKLLSRGGEPTDGALAKTLGLDEVGFASPSTSADGTTSEAAVTVGKRVSDKLYLSYEQSLAGAVSTVSILYDLSKSFTLRARAGTENAVDVIFTHRYD